MRLFWQEARGSRMRKDGYDTPKPLLPILGVPNIERTIWMLHDFGIDDITILCSSNYLKQYQFLWEKYHCHILHNSTHRNILFSVNQAISLFNDTFVIEGDLVLARNIFSRQNKSFYYVMRYPRCEIDAWHPVLEGNRISAFETGCFSEPCILGGSFWVQKDYTLLKSILREYFTEENFRNNSLFWDDCIAGALDRIWIGVREIKADEACEMNTGTEYIDAQKLCSKYYQNCLRFILDYGSEEAVHPHTLTFVQNLELCGQWQEQLLNYVDNELREPSGNRNSTVFTQGEFPFMVKDTQAGKYVAYFDIAEAPDYILLRRLFVAQESRGRGIGQEIVTCIRLYAKLSSKELRVNVYDMNAEQFYRKLGMKPYFKTFCSTVEDLL